MLADRQQVTQMCLQTINKKPRYGDGVYYKVFKRSLCGTFVAQYFPRTYKMGVWYRKRKKEIHHTSRGDPLPMKITAYEPGFHAYVNKKQAMKDGNDYSNIIMKVELKDIKTTGLNYNGYHVVVADRMKLLEEC